MNQPRIVEMYVNSYLDRIVEENGSTSTQFTVPLEEKSKQIQLMPNERSLKLKVFSAEIPNVLYNFKPTEDRLWFAYDNSIASIEIDTERIYASPTALMDESIHYSHRVLWIPPQETQQATYRVYQSLMMI